MRMCGYSARLLMGVMAISSGTAFCGVRSGEQAVKLITPTRGDLAHDGSSPVTIDRSGIYRLTGNMTGDGSYDLITISASDVTLDLNGATLLSGDTGLAVTGTDVTVSNGTVKSCTTTGVQVASHRCTLDGIDVIGTPTGFYFNGATYAQVSDCHVCQGTLTGFYLRASSYNQITNCSVSEVTHAGITSGFLATCGSNNIFENCSVVDIASTRDTLTSYAQGFRFSQEDSSQVVDCTVNGVSTTQTLSECYGIVMTTSVPLVTEATYAQRGSSLEWAALDVTPGGNDYLLVGHANSGSITYKLRILELTGGTILTEIDDWSAFASNQTINSVAWGSEFLGSYPSRYFAAGLDHVVGFNNVYIFFFASLAGTPITLLSAADHGADVYSVDILTIGPYEYVAIGGATGTSSKEVRIYEYLSGGTLNDLWQLAPGVTVNSVNWNTINSTNYLAFGTALNGSGDELQVYSFDGLSLTSKDSVNVGIAINSVKWFNSPSGKYYVGVGTANGTGTTDELRIYEFDASSETLTERATYRPVVTGETINSVAWLAGNGCTNNVHYLALGVTVVPVDLHIVTFDETTNTVAPFFTFDSSSTVYGVDWLTTADGISYLAQAFDGGTEDVRLHALSSYLESENCIIKNNLVHNVSGGVVGIGYAVPDNATNNLMIDNVAYNNDTNYDPAAVDSSNQSF